MKESQRRDLRGQETREGLLQNPQGRRKQSYLMAARLSQQDPSDEAGLPANQRGEEIGLLPKAAPCWGFAPLVPV